MHKDIDDEIRNLLNKEESVPMSVKNKKEEAFNIIRDMNKDELKNERKLFNKKNIAVAVVVIVIGANLTTPILANVKQLIFNGRYKGIQTAINSGYEQNISEVYSESNGIRLEVVKASIDSTMINFKFKVTSKDIKNMKKFKYTENGASINRFNISDDKGRVLQFYDAKEGIGTEPLIDENGQSYFLISGSDESVDVSDIDNGNVYFDIILHSQGNLEKIKSLDLQTNSIANFNGDWNLHVKLDKVMTKENVTKYLVATKNNNVDILEAEGTATGLMIKFKLNKSVDENIISKVKLIDKDGREYRTDRPASIDVANGSNIVKITFEASKFDNVDRFDFVIENVDGKDEVVKLAKE